MYKNKQDSIRKFLEMIVVIKRLISNPISVAVLLAMYLVVAPGAGVYNGVLTLVNEAEASSQSHNSSSHNNNDPHHGHNHKHKHNKAHSHSHKHDGVAHTHSHKHDSGSVNMHSGNKYHGHSHNHEHESDYAGFEFNETRFATDTNCDPADINRLQIFYHEDFISTENADGPNILVVGADVLPSGNYCRIGIVKITGGKKCGYKVTTVNKKLFIETINKNNVRNCEMIIHVVVPRNIFIYGG
jgi:hypothetical protein